MKKPPLKGARERDKGDSAERSDGAEKHVGQRAAVSRVDGTMIMAGVVMIMVMTGVVMVILKNVILVRSSVVLKVFRAELRTDNFGECAIAGFDQ